VLASGRVLAVAGANVGTIASCEVYDPVTGTWSPTGALATQRAVHTTTLLASGRVLVAAGRRPSGTIAMDSAEEYFPLTGSWSDAGDRIFAYGFETF